MSDETRKEPTQNAPARGRDASGRWLKGFAPNPGGRPRSPAREVQEAVRSLTPKAIKRLGELLDDRDHRIRLEALKVVLERFAGKPKEALELSGPDGGPLQVDHRAIVATLVARLSRPSDDTATRVLPRVPEAIEGIEPTKTSEITASSVEPTTTKDVP